MHSPQKSKAIKASNVFLDTGVFVEANFNYQSPRLVSIAELAQSGRIRVFLTEITVREIKAKIKELVERAAAARPHSILRNSSLPQVRALFEPLDPTAVEKELFSQFEAFIKDARITVLPVEEKFLGPVIDNYFNRQPPFGLGKNKAEFPDALALETLKAWCQVERHGMAVVTRDEGIKAACSDNGPLHHFLELPSYLDAVASEEEVLSDFIRKMISLHDNVIIEKAKEAFPYLGFGLIDQDGEVGDVELKEIEFDIEAEIISLKADEAIIEMPATLIFQAEISYYDPGTGSYDNEDGVMIFQETVHSTVIRKAHRSIAVQVTFMNMNPNSFEVRRVWFEGKQDIDFESDYNEGYPYK